MRSLLTVALLLFGLAPAVAQAPPAVPALPDTARLTSYSLSGTTCACSVGFALYGDGNDVDNWLTVWINGTQYLSTDSNHGWALSSVTGPLSTIPRPITDAVLTFNLVQTGTVQIVGARRPRRTTQFPENRGIAARDLNQALTDIIAQLRENWDPIRGLFGSNGWPPSKSGTTNTLASVNGPLTSGACLDFDGVGNIVAGSGACVSAGSGVTAGSAGQVGYYASTGSVISATGKLILDGSNNFIQSGGMAILGDVNAGGIFPPTGDGQGMAVDWNFTSGAGEVDLFNRFTGIGALTNASFNWYQLLTSSSARLIMSLDAQGTLTLAPTAASLNQGLKVNQTGPTTGSAGSSDFAFNLINISSDQVNGSGEVEGLEVIYTYGGTNMHGARFGLNVLSTLSAAPADDNSYQGFNTVMSCVVNAGGTGTGGNARGSCYAEGINVQTSATATFFHTIAGSEADVDMVVGSSADVIFGYNAVKGNNCCGNAIDMAFAVGGNAFQNGGRWQYGFGLTDANGHAPIDATGTVLGAKSTGATTPPWTVTWGVDFTDFTFSSAAWRGNFTLNGHIGTKSASTPGNSSCPGYSAAAGSSDLAGTLTMTPQVTCTLNFSTTFTNTPFCLVTSSGGATPASVATSTTQLSVTFGSAQPGFTWLCMGV